MEIKILQVFYGKDGLPYKDKDRQVHFPIAGTGFLGASNTTKIKFYYEELDNLDETSWVAVSKLPNGKVGSRVLESYLDEELKEHYALLELDNYYTQYKGDVFISLQGYQGGVDFDYDEENSQYEIHGTPTIAATGSIKFTINYANQFVGSGETDNINFQRILAALGTKLGMRAYSEHVEELPSEGSPDVFYVVNDDPNDPNLANIYVWNENTRHYIWVGDNTLDLGDYYTQEQGEQFESDVREELDGFDDRLSAVASGTPRGAYPTVGDLESADPNHNYIYVVEQDGYWYYWNTTNQEWTRGTLYQTPIDGIENYMPLFNNHSGDIIPNAYVGGTGGALHHHDSLNVIKLSCYGAKTATYSATMETPDLRGFAFYDENDTCLIAYQISTVPQTVNVPNGAVYAMATFETNPNVFILDMNASDLCESFFKNEKDKKNHYIIKYNANQSDITDNQYVDNGGIVHSHESLKTIKIFTLYGATLTYFPTMQTPDFRGFAFYSEDGSFISGYQIAAQPRTVAIPENATYCLATIEGNPEDVVVNLDASILSKQITDALSQANISLLRCASETNVHDGYFIEYISGGIATLSGSKYVEIYVKGARNILYKAHMSTPDWRGLAFYDEANRFISGVQIGTTAQTIAVPNGAFICRASLLSTNTSKDVVLDINTPDILELITTDYYVKNYNTNTSDFISSAYVSYADGTLASYSDNSANIIKVYVKCLKTISYYTTTSPLDARGLAFYDENMNFISGLQTLTTKQENISVPTNAVYCYATVKRINELVLNIDSNLVNEKVNALIPAYNTDSSDIVEDYYIGYSGGYAGEFVGLKYIECCVKGINKIIYKATTTPPDLRGLAFYDDGGNFISGVQMLTTPQEISVPNGAVTCKATILKKEDLQYVVDANILCKLIGNQQSSNGPELNILSAFDNIVCIGDSLTYSQVYTSDNDSRQAYVPYPKCIQKRTGTTTVGIAQGGATAQYWWNNFNQLLEQKQNQLAIIYLGTNYGLTDTLSTDAPVSEQDYTQWADTNTGCYAKIVAKCQALGMKVLLLKIWATSGDMGVNTTNNVIDQIGTRFGCAVVDKINLTDLKYHYYPDLTGSNGVHYNDLGYSAFADALINKVSLLSVDQMKLIIPD